MDNQRSSQKLLVLATVAVAFANALIGPCLHERANPAAVLLYVLQNPSYLSTWLVGGFGGYFIFAALTALFTFRTKLQRLDRESWIKFMFWSTVAHLAVLGFSASSAA